MDWIDVLELEAALTDVPQELRDLPNWVCWKLEERNGKPTKVPINAHSGKDAKSNDRATWASLDTALQALRNNLRLDGVGCMIAPPYVGIDLDKCRDPETGIVQQWALDAIRELDTYTEFSPGSGFHLWVKGKIPPGGNRRGHVEMYAQARYFTVTGRHFEGTPLTINHRDLTAFHTKYITQGTPNGTAAAPDIGKDTSPSAKEFKEACKIAEEIVRRLGSKATVDDVTVEFYERVPAREKWERHRTYVERTIAKALETVRGKLPNTVETTIILQSFADVQAKPIVWMWKDRIPKAKLTIFSGNPDVGKSTVLCDIIARYTTGRDYPDGAPNTIGPSGVLMLIAEDDPADTVKPRLMAAGADLARVSFLKAVRISKDSKREERMLALDTDLTLLELELQNNPQIGLVSIDPITSYLGKADLNKEQELRRVLGPIKELAERTGVTFIGLGHFNKRADVSALHKVGGAVAMSGVARAVWLFAKNPDTEGEYLMLLGKGNLTRKRGGLKYRIGSKELATLGEQPFIAWQGEADGDADTVLAMERDPDQKRRAKAERFLTEYLAAGPARSDDIQADAKNLHISRNALFEAKKELRITASQRWDEGSVSGGGLCHRRTQNPTRL